MASRPSPPEEPRAPLPAPYDDPWRRLGADLVAVGAAAVLKARELWRLNGEGRLPRPPFWPDPLAPLLWPLVVILALLALGLTVALAFSPHPGTSPGGEGTPGPAARSAVRAPVAAAPGRATAGGVRPPADRSGERSIEPWPDSATDRADGRGASSADPSIESTTESTQERTIFPSTDSALDPTLDSTTDPTANPTADPSTDRNADPIAESESGSSSAIHSGSLSEPGRERAAEPTPPPLLSELVGPPPPAWILGLEDRPPEGLLRLRVTEEYSSLPLAERRTLVERWLERSRDLGYERLEVVDARDRLLARPARVGSGMILLDSALSSP